MNKAFAALLLLASPATAETRAASFLSPSLGREVSYVVDLPPSYASGKKAYPILYALHGLFEGPAFWEGRGLAPILRNLEEKGEVPEMVVVAVEGRNSFFVNAPGGRYEDLVTRDLVAHVESTYRVAPGREARALLGVSMGGYAALRIAFREPRLFRAVASHSAMLLLEPPTPEEGAGRWHMDAFHRVFGNPIDPDLWMQSDPLRLAETADPKTVPALYFDCGSEDRFGLFAGNQALHDRLRSRGVPHEFGLHPGDHGYEYVRSVLDLSLRFIGSRLRGEGASAGAPAQAPIVVRKAEAKGIAVHYLNVPWGPSTFTEMEKGLGSYHSKRTWPFARLETRVAVTMDGTRVPAGNYALVFHPNDGTHGMALEVLKIGVPEFLQPGNPLTPTPPGESLLKKPIVFEADSETAPALDIRAEPKDGAVRLEIRYGDRRLVQELRIEPPQGR